MQHFTEEVKTVKRAAQATREQELRQEKLMQMIVQMQEEQDQPDPEASSKGMPPPSTKAHMCKCIVLEMHLEEMRSFRVGAPCREV